MTDDRVTGVSAGGGDFFSFADDESYVPYFRQLQKVLGHVESCQQRQEPSAVREAPMFGRLVTMLRHSLELIGTRHAGRGPDVTGCRIDVTESGFPNQLEIAALERDLQLREQRLREMPAAATLRRLLVEELFRQTASPEPIIRQLATRSYFDHLLPDVVFLPYTRGELVRLETAEASPVRRYLCSWGAYDFTTNRPFLTVMTCEQDASLPPLEEENRERARLSAVLASEGSRGTRLGVLAMTLDEALESIRPKLLRRLCIGPFYSRRLLGDCEPNAIDLREVYFRRLLDTSSGRMDDFVLLLTEEQVFSRRSETVRTVFAPAGRTREIFAIDETDPECAERAVSSVQHCSLMPHELLQHVHSGETGTCRDFSDGKKLTVDQRGELYGL